MCTGVSIAVQAVHARLRVECHVEGLYVTINSGLAVLEPSTIRCADA